LNEEEEQSVADEGGDGGEKDIEVKRSSEVTNVKEGPIANQSHREPRPVEDKRGLEQLWILPDVKNRGFV